MPEEIKVNFIEYEKIDFSDYTLIEGFPGMGLVGTIGAKYLAERMNFREIGYIDANVFIPIIRIHQGIPVNPSRIYANDKMKLAIIISEQIIPRYYTDKLAKAVVEWIKEKKFKRLISLEGINADPTQQKEVIYGIAANEKSKKLLEQYGIKIVSEGITTGITSLMLLELKKTNMEAFSILGNVNIQADYKAAAALLEKLNKILGLNISIEPLMKEAKETEKELLKHLDNIKKTHGEVQKLEEDQPQMYT